MLVVCKAQVIACMCLKALEPNDVNIQNVGNMRSINRTKLYKISHATCITLTKKQYKMHQWKSQYSVKY